MQNEEIERQLAIEKLLRKMANAIDTTISSLLGKMGFALLVFDFGRPGLGHYISNANRSDIIKALRETANRLEKKQDIPPAGHTIQ